MTIDQVFQGWTPRLLALTTLFALVLGLLTFKLWREQVRSAATYQATVKQQSTRRIRVAPVRGRIFTADGQALADNVPVYEVLFHLQEMRPAGRATTRKTLRYIRQQIGHAAALIGRGNPATEDLLTRHLRVYPALPFRAFTELTPAELARLDERLPGIPGMEISVSFRRYYPLAEAGAQLIGFVGRCDPAADPQRGDRQQYWYFSPEVTGRSGLERRFDERLRGRGGCRLVRVDHAGLVHSESAVADEAPQAGDDLILTLDQRAQLIAQELINPYRGAVVLVECNTGAVLALASGPSYNLNTLSGDAYAALAADHQGRPLVNRALAGGYTPGSIIKPLIALSMLESGAFQPSDQVVCEGYHTVGNRSIRCTQQHGAVNLVEALEGSCNTYFIAAGLATGIDQLGLTLASAGIGQPTGFPVATYGDSGLLPTREMKRRRLHAGWTAGDTAFISIGQGLITISPLQAALYCAALANGGTLYRPAIVRAWRAPDGTLHDAMTRQVAGQLATSPENLAVVREGMRRVVNAEGATGSQAANEVISLAGKTGTAELSPRNDRRKNTWFICYGPLEDPRYALAILVEDGASGGKTVAPLARDFFVRWLAPPEQVAAAPR